MGRIKELRRLGNLFKEMFKQRFGQQTDLINLISQRLDFIFDPSFRGFLPDEEAALRTQATERISTGFQEAQRQVQGRSFILGGRRVPSGAQIALGAGLTGQEFATRQQAQQDISIEGGRRRLQSIFGASQLLSGLAAQLDPTQFAQLNLAALEGRRGSGIAGQIGRGITGGLFGLGASFLGGPAFGPGGKGFGSFFG